MAQNCPTNTILISKWKNTISLLFALSILSLVSYVLDFVLCFYLFLSRAQAPRHFPFTRTSVSFCPMSPLIELLNWTCLSFWSVFFCCSSMHPIYSNIAALYMFIIVQIVLVNVFIHALCAAETHTLFHILLH